MIRLIPQITQALKAALTKEYSDHTHLAKTNVHVNTKKKTNKAETKPNVWQLTLLPRVSPATVEKRLSPQLHTTAAPTAV